MLDINLVPNNLRKRKKRKSLLKGFNIPMEVVIGSAGGLFLILILVHILLLFAITAKVSHKNQIAQEAKELEPAKIQVEAVISQLRKLQARQNSLKQVIGDDKVRWAKKLNEISDSLTDGVWLTKISFNEEIFFIKGSALSTQGREMVGVHNFTSSLKKREDFMDGFEDFSPGSIQIRKIKDIKIADFLIKIRIK